jgi:phosphate transport system permease protein
VIIGMAPGHRRTAPIITIGALTFIAFLPPAPLPANRLPACSTGWPRPSP